MATTFPGQVNLASGVNLKITTGNVHDTTPTKAQITTEFGAPATVGAGFVGVINDAAGSTNFYFVASDGTEWFWTKMTKAL